ncbi:hypothetical protein SAMN02745857_02865 [Andreprevotia lacus DSM 23236]|uniref:Immunity protein Imm33 domain-containing protein n=1 Tax=Andreprevotia lacus DSM 23236 TaxID=1121001 RepID=A0A1W1XUD7_9NEIS|nr:DUF2185 domain-containing protein [Andreprevotia lacus]SMC27474.1 hypothetical protein SAMN02745857_02865 [Andreprevotia lacus DSM 23236]
MAKHFKLAPHELKPLIEGHGDAFATDRIVVDGAPVGFMYREEPEDKDDSGWRLLAGDESDEYMDNPKYLGVYKLNTLANYDPSIIPLLDAPVGSAFEKLPDSDEFYEVEDWS